KAPSNLAIIGRYILTPEIFDVLEETQTGAGGELQLTDGIRSLLKKQKVYAYVYEGKRHDTGDKLGFLKATVEFALKREDLGGAMREYLRGLKLDRSCGCSAGPVFSARRRRNRRPLPCGAMLRTHRARPDPGD